MLQSELKERKKHSNTPPLCTDEGALTRLGENNRGSRGIIIIGGRNSSQHLPSTSEGTRQ